MTSRYTTATTWGSPSWCGVSYSRACADALLARHGRAAETPEEHRKMKWCWDSRMTWDDVARAFPGLRQLGFEFVGTYGEISARANPVAEGNYRAQVEALG